MTEHRNSNIGLNPHGASFTLKIKELWGVGAKLKKFENGQKQETSPCNCLSV